MIESDRSDRPKTGIVARTAARDAILGRVGAATAQFRPDPIERTYRTTEHDSEAKSDLVEQFIDRLLDYKAAVALCRSDDVATQITQFLAQEQARNVVVPSGFPSAWLAPPADGARWLGDNPPLSVDALDRADGVVTTCAVAVAETGTIVLDAGEGQGRRALTLLPDLHLIVVTGSQLVPRVPHALPLLDPSRPLTWISGPSATSDIELNRVEGVHGPRRLRVVLAID